MIDEPKDAPPEDGNEQSNIEAREAVVKALQEKGLEAFTEDPRSESEPEPAPEPEPEPEPQSVPQMTQDDVRRMAEMAGLIVRTPEEQAEFLTQAQALQLEPEPQPEPQLQIPNVQLPPEAEDWTFDQIVDYRANEIASGLVQQTQQQIMELQQMMAPLYEQQRAQYVEQTIVSAATAIAKERGVPDAASAFADAFRSMKPELLQQYDTDPAVKELIDLKLDRIADGVSKAKLPDPKPVPRAEAVTTPTEDAPEIPNMHGQRAAFNRSRAAQMGIKFDDLMKGYDQ